MNMQVIHICTAPIYEYQGWRFEVHGYFGPWPIRRDNDEPFKRVGEKSKFWEVWSEFDNLPDAEQRKHRVGGGCYHGGGA